MGEQLLRLLLYADDLALLASSAAQLHRLLSALHEFCVEYDMEVNVAKTEIVIFGRREYDKLDRLQGRWRYNGQPVPVSKEFKYLGVVLHCTKGVAAAVPTLAAAGRRAMWAMLQKVGKLDLQSLHQKVVLFDALVVPILSFCCDVWAPDVLSASLGSLGCLDNELQRVQMLFLRCIAGGVRKSTPRFLLLRELGCSPLVRGWFRSMLGFWNRVASSRPEGLLYQCLVEDLRLHNVVSYGVKSWCHQFCKVLQHVGIETSQLMVEHDGRPLPQQLNLSTCMNTFDDWFLRIWSDLPPDPRSAPSHQVVYSVYDQWFASAKMCDLEDEAKFSTCPRHVLRTAGINTAHVASLLRFRLGAHDLPVVTCRWGVDLNTRQRVPRQNRQCQHCSSGAVGDEFHMVFECGFYDQVRSRFSQLFERFGGHTSLTLSTSAAGPSMSDFMGQDRRLVAAFIHTCWLYRCNPALSLHLVHELSGSDVDVESDDILQVELAELLPD